MTPPVHSAAVIGLGLIGGSMARDLMAHGVRVSGFDTDRSQLDHAIADGVVRRALDASLDGLREVDLVVLAVPVDAALELLPRVAAKAVRARLITDVGSTKARLVARATELRIGSRFVGGHPMAGDHRSGWAASRQGLFQDAPLYLCHTKETGDEARELAATIWRLLGARLIEIDPEMHDEQLAWTSHLPHMIAVTLGRTLAAGGVKRDALGPGGRDMTRIAGSSPEMWAPIAVENAAAIDRALEVAEREIGELRRELARHDGAAMRVRFAGARSWFDS